MTGHVAAGGGGERARAGLQSGRPAHALPGGGALPHPHTQLQHGGLLLHVRCISIVVAFPQGWAEAAQAERGLAGSDPALAAGPTTGLTPWGERVVREMNRLGMMVDLGNSNICISAFRIIFGQ